MIFVHFFTLLFLLVTIAIADHEGYQWMRGKKETLSKKKVATLHLLVGIGLTAMVVSGAIMAWPVRSVVFTDAEFLIKMGFVVALVVNSFFVGKYSNLAAERSFASLEANERRNLLVSGVVSTLGWGGAFISALVWNHAEWTTYFLSLLLPFLK